MSSSNVRRRRCSTVAVCAIATAVLGVGCGGSDEGASDGELRGVVDDLTHDVFVGVGLASGKQRFHVPGTALTVIPVDGSLRTFTSGDANIATDEPRLADQVQPVGSNTKVMTATVVMQLVEDGRVGLEDTLPRIAQRNRADGGRLSTLVAEFRAKVRRVTLRELLNHTS